MSQNTYFINMSTEGGDNSYTGHANLSGLSGVIIDPLSDEMYEIVIKVVLTIIFSVIFLGIVTNSLNIRVFLRMGLEDSVTISFFILAISDLSVCVIALGSTTSAFIELAEREGKVSLYFSPGITSLYIEMVRKMFGLTTVGITTFLAVQRCLCVLIPFHVKGMFTKFRTYCYICVLFLFSVTSCALYISRHGVVKYTFQNSTKLRYVVLPGSELYFMLHLFVVGTVLNCASQIVIVACLIVMFVTLRKTATFRKSASIEVPIQTKTETGASKEKITTKETQAIKQVAVISTIFVMANTPVLAFGIASVIVPEFKLMHALHNLFYTCACVYIIAECLNSSVNFFVYYKFNSKFKKAFQSLSKGTET